MFGNKGRNYGSLIALVGGAVASGVAALSLPALKRRALRATTILKKDHRVVSGLFWTLQQATVPTIRQAIFNKIQSELDVHATVEEEIFYPAVRNLYSANSEAQVEEARREHLEIRRLCNEVALIDPSSYMFMSKANELKEIIEHHVEEEENEMFPLVHRLMSNDELYNLGRRMHDRKHQFEERVAA
jgi:hemerythrin superfamily protein